MGTVGGLNERDVKGDEEPPLPPNLTQVRLATQGAEWQEGEQGTDVA